MDLDLTTLQQMESLTELLVSIGWVLGLALFVAGFVAIKKHSEAPNQHSLSTAIMMIFAGVMLISLDAFYLAVVGTFTPDAADGARDILLRNAVTEYASSLNTNALSDLSYAQYLPTDLGPTLIGFVYVVGLLSFIKGIYLLKDVGVHNQQNVGARSATHIIGGVLAMNILDFSCIIGEFVGIQAFCLA